MRGKTQREAELRQENVLTRTLLAREMATERGEKGE